MIYFERDDFLMGCEIFTCCHCFIEMRLKCIENISKRSHFRGQKKTVENLVKCVRQLIQMHCLTRKTIALSMDWCARVITRHIKASIALQTRGLIVNLQVCTLSFVLATVDILNDFNEKYKFNRLTSFRRYLAQINYHNWMPLSNQTFWSGKLLVCYDIEMLFETKIFGLRF